MKEVNFNSIRARGEGKGLAASNAQRADSATLDTAVQHILVPVDFTECSCKATQYAAGLAKGQRAKVTLLHVVDLNFNWPDTGPVNVARFREEMWAESAEKLQRLVQALGSAGVLISPVIRDGAPWEETVAFAESNQVGLIVLGQRPRRHGWRLFRRHTAKRIAETASCPVLVLLEKDSSGAVPRSLRSITSGVP